MAFDIAPGVRIFLISLAIGQASLTTLPYLFQHVLFRGKDFTDMRRRAWSWWPVSLILVGALVGGPVLTWAVMAAIAAWGLRELLSIQDEPAPRAVTAVAFGLLALQFVLGYLGSITWFSLLIPMAGMALITLTCLLSASPDGFQRRVGTVFLAVMATGFGLSHFAGLTLLGENSSVQTPASGVLGLALFVGFLGQFNDLLQYMWGKALGRRRILPQVSPGKTWEGFLGAALSTAGLGWLLAPLLSPFSRPEGAAVGFGLAVLGFLGDVTISAIKRDVGVKDTGRVLPGFGGVMDRVDSLVFAAPAAFYYVGWMYGGL